MNINLLVCISCLVVCFESSSSQHINTSSTQQTIQGWGTSLCWWANSLGHWPTNSNSTVAATYNKLMDLLFDVEKGLGINMVRYNIGGGENPNNGHFMRTGALVEGYEPGKGQYDTGADASQRKILQDAIQRGVNIVHAFSNSPAFWMTQSGSTTGAQGGGNNLRDDMYDDFAEYLAQVVYNFKTNAAYGPLTFTAVTPLNEPVSNWWKYGGDQEGCHFDRDKEADILLRLKQKLKNLNITDVYVSGPEENSLDDTLTSLMSYNDSVVDAIDVISTHTYNGVNRQDLSVYAKKHNKILWNSEFGTGSGPLQGGINLASRICLDMNELQPTVWTLWQSVDMDNSLSANGWGHLAATYPPENLYILQTLFSGASLCLTFTSIKDGSQVFMRPCTGTTNQAFFIDTLQIQVGNNSGPCLDDWGQSAQYGNDIKLYSCWGGKNQQWSLNENLQLQLGTNKSMCLGYDGTTVIVDYCVNALTWSIQSIYDFNRYTEPRTTSSRLTQPRGKSKSLRNLQDASASFEANFVVRKQYYAYFMFTTLLRPDCQVVTLNSQDFDTSSMLAATCKGYTALVVVNSSLKTIQKTLTFDQSFSVCSSKLTDSSHDASDQNCQVQSSSLQIQLPPESIANYKLM